MGILHGIEATISVDQHATPRFHRYCPVPFAVKEKVKKTLQRQVAEGELIPMETSEWATPIVIVDKWDGNIHICGDFKLTVNPVICLQVYPLPTPEEMLSILARVHNIIEEESILLSNILYKRVLQSYDAIVIVTFKVLSDHVMFLKHIDIFNHVNKNRLPITVKKSKRSSLARLR